MTNKRPFAPTILQKLDNYLLQNKPEIWSARTHLVMYYGFLLMALLTGICFIIPDDARSRSNIGCWAIFIVVICIIALIGWLIFLLRFNVFKRFGNITAIGRLTTFLLYFIAIGTIVALAFVQPTVECIRANKAYSDQEIITDVNTINLNIAKIEFDSIHKNWRFDTVTIVAQKNYQSYTNKHDNVEVDDATAATDTSIIHTPITHQPFEELTAEEFKTKEERGDSIIKINDSMYQAFKTPDLQVFKVYQAGKKVQNKFLNSLTIFNIATKEHAVANKKLLKQQIVTLTKKYNYGDRTVTYSDNYNSNYLSFADRYYRAYELERANNSINNIADRKAIWDKENIPLLFRLFFYFTFTITLLVFLFRHTTTKVFFLSLLTGFVILVFNSLLSAFIRYKEASSLLWLLIFFFVFATIASFVVKNKKRNVITGISINLFVLMVAYIPTLALTYYQSILFSGNYYNNNNELYMQIRSYYVYAEVLGVVMLLILMPTYIHFLYRKWYALPQE